MSHTPSSSNPDDEPTEDFEVVYIGDGEHGFIGLIQTKFHAPEERDIPAEEQQAAAYRYMANRLGLQYHSTAMPEIGTEMHEWIERYVNFSPTEWQKRVIDDIMRLHDEDPERFRREREEVRRQLSKGVGIYDQMIHRTVDGSDPLVEEPGP